MIRTAVIIDDDADDVALLKEIIITQYPIAVQTFTVAREGLRYLAEMEKPADFIFTDFNMPVLKGDEVVSLLRVNPRYSSSVITVLSTGMSEGTAFRLKTLGADFTYQKPNRYAELATIIARVVEQQKVAVFINPG